MTTILIIIGVVLGIILLNAFAKSTAREAKRITHEVNFRVDSIDTLCKSASYLLTDNDKEAIRLERKAARLKARAEEVASRQTSGWKAYSRVVRKHR